MLGYAESIGQKTSTIAELTALHRGLELALENGWRNVWLEGDAMTLIDIIVHRRPVRSEEVQRIIGDINVIISELGSCNLTHIYREGNRAADKFAKMGHKLLEPRIWRNPPKEVLPLVIEDAKGKNFTLPCSVTFVIIIFFAQFFFSILLTRFKV
ncbi:hypothetical protein Sjap_025458 [Stephania japonica]|uniref:RNase H type-1 domain-containing protein n=1 Tax=Stephania japonica TaxID=461633 RepID=A0AAP0HHK1_9MAGN